ncbi:MAG: hypothetical protein ACTSU2_05425 [Promethearchaeota archaeon]
MAQNKILDSNLNEELVYSIKMQFLKNFRKYSLISIIFEFIYSFILGLLAYLPTLIKIDALYWPPFMLFTLQYQRRWLTLVIVLLSITFFQSIFSLFITLFARNKKNKIGDVKGSMFKDNIFGKIFKFLILFLASFQLLFIPIGTYTGLTILFQYQILQQIIKANRSNEPDTVATYKKTLEDFNQIYQLHKGEPKDKLKKFRKLGSYSSKNREYKGLIIIFISLFFLALIYTFYLFTVYLSTVMLDLTYPYLTISVIYKIRWGLLIFTLIFFALSFYGAYIFLIKRERKTLKNK